MLVIVSLRERAPFGIGRDNAESCRPVSFVLRLSHRDRADDALRPDGCRPTPASVYNLLDPTNRTIASCDSAGCDAYDAVIRQSGVFLNIASRKTG
jgi:hypothetical protein